MYILDTHTLPWFLSDAPELSEDTKRFIANQDIAAVSIASLWEIAIKQSLNKLRLNGTIRDEDATLITRDEKIPLYPVKTMSV